jgi:hypothetical protein
MDYIFEIIITTTVLAAYGAIRLIIDFVLLINKLVTKLANYAQTVKKQYKTTDDVDKSATKVDKRNKYTVNVDSCEQYLKSVNKIN